MKRSPLIAVLTVSTMLNIHGLKPEKDNRSYGIITGIGWKY